MSYVCDMYQFLCIRNVHLEILKQILFLYQFLRMSYVCDMYQFLCIRNVHLEILKQIIPFWNNLDGRLEILKQIIQIWNNLSRNLEIPKQIVNSTIDHISTLEVHHWLCSSWNRAAFHDQHEQTEDDHLEILKQIIPFWNNLDGRFEILKQIIQIWNNLSRHLEIPEQIVNSAIDHNSKWELIPKSWQICVRSFVRYSVCPLGKTPG